MIVCKNCGHQNDDNDTFCGSCGKFLEWTGERVAVAEPEPEPAPPPPAPVAEPTHLGLMDRVKHAVGIDETTASTAQPVEPAQPAAAPPPPSSKPAPIAASAPPPPPSHRPVPMTSSAPAPAAPSAPPVTPAPSRFAAGSPPQPSAGVGQSLPEREPVLAGVGAPTAPGATSTPLHEDEPLSRRPTSVAPAAARPRRAVRPMEAPTRHRPGDLICGQCGEGNDPTRHFCRRCGNTLDEAIAVQLPWYRRLWNRLVGPKTYTAGYRHGRIGPPNVLSPIFRIIRLAIAALIIVAILAFVFVPSFHSLVVDRATSAVTSVRKIVHPNYDPINPTGASASSSIAGHLPTLAIDGFKNTYWAGSPSDRTPTLVLHLAAPTDLAEIGFTSGASGAAPTDQFLAQPRPHNVHLVFSDGSAQDISLADSATAQFTQLTSAKQVTFVEIHILSVWPTAGAAPSSVAITEVEFRIKD